MTKLHTSLQSYLSFFLNECAKMEMYIEVLQLTITFILLNIKEDKK